MITRADVEAASRRIDGLVRRTPMVRLEPGDLLPRNAVWLKLEHLQHTGSFKARGATNRIRAAAAAGEIGNAGVVAASGGNAGLAVAWAAANGGVPARIFVPDTAPAFKVARLQEMGATVVQVGVRYADAYAAAVDDVEQTGALLCHAYDQTEICAGQGTVGLELLEQAPGTVDEVVVAVGGGGLLAGVATAVAGTASLVAVEPETAPTLHAALAAGAPVDVDVTGIAADSLGATRVGDIAWDVVGRVGVTSVLVPDRSIAEARRLLWDRFRLVVEHGAATAVAALTTGVHRPAADATVAVVVCGANTDPADLAAPMLP